MILTDLINLTPHDVVVRTSNGDVTIPRSGSQARVDVEEFDLGIALSGVPVFQRRWATVSGLPDQGAYLVSSIVLDHVTHRPGRRCFAPDTGSTAIRDDAGRIVAVTRLIAEYAPE